MHQYDALATSKVAAINLFNGLIKADAITANARVRGAASALIPTVTGSSSLVNLVINGKPISISTSPNTTINVGVVALTLNEQTTFTSPDKGLTVNAVHIKVNALGLAAVNVIVASSESDIGNCP